LTAGAVTEHPPSSTRTTAEISFLRQKGFVVLRYAKRQFIQTPAAVADDLLVHLAREL
jgi:very-short-patch-repair endonuclease